MNNELKKAKNDLRKIEQFCKSRPMKSPHELRLFLTENDLIDLLEIAALQHELEGKKAYFLYTKKINRARL